MRGSSVRSPGQWIHFAFERQKIKKPSLSFRSLAKDLGVNSSFLLKAVKDKKKISLRRAVQLSYLLKMTDSERSRFLDSVALQAALNRNSRQLVDRWILSRLDANKNPLLDRPTPRDYWTLLSHYSYLAILDLATCTNFQPEIDWISKKLQLPKKRVKKSVDLLLQMGLLRPDGDRWVKAQEHIYIPTQKSEASVRKYHRQVLDLAKRELSQTKDSDFKRRNVSSMTVAVDPSRIIEAKALISKFQDEITKLVTEGDCKEVYQLNVQFFPLTKLEEKFS